MSFIDLAFMAVMELEICRDLENYIIDSDLRLKK